MRDFIWGGYKPRLRLDHLSLPKPLGGVGLSDLNRYYWACHLTRIVDWNVHSDTKVWVGQESASILGKKKHTPWLLKMATLVVHPANPMLDSIVQAFKVACRSTKISSNPGPLTPFERQPCFPPRIICLLSDWLLERRRAISWPILWGQYVQEESNITYWSNEPPHTMVNLPENSPFSCWLLKTK